MALIGSTLRFFGMQPVLSAPPATKPAQPSTSDDTNIVMPAFGHRELDRNRNPRPGEGLLALLRAGHHSVHLDDEDELLRVILADAVSCLDAQRGAITLMDGEHKSLRLRVQVAGANRKPISKSFSQHLARRAFDRGESILWQWTEDDPEIAMAGSVTAGMMASVLCVILRTPRHRIGVVHLDRGPGQKPFTHDDLHLGDALAAHIAAGIENARLLRNKRNLFYASLATLAQAVELRDQYTGGHTNRVTAYALLLGKELGLSPAELHLLRVGTPLHDIGKIGIADKILQKPGRLTPDEFEAMKTHAAKGARMLEQMDDVAVVVPIVRSHHERWDGRGYPDGLAGENIPLLARLVAVCDSFDAMTSDRPYRKGMPVAAAFAELQKGRGTQFDPTMVDAFLRIRATIVREMSKSEAEKRPTSAVKPGSGKTSSLAGV